MLAVIAVCYHPGYGANHKGGQHAHDKEPAHREAGLTQFCNQSGGGNQVEPIAQQTDDLTEPQVAKVGIATYQRTVAGWAAALGCS